MGRFIKQTLTRIPVIDVIDGDRLMKAGRFSKNFQLDKKGFVSLMSSSTISGKIRNDIVFWTQKTEDILLAEHMAIDEALFGEAISDHLGWFDRDQFAISAKCWAHKRLRWRPKGGFHASFPLTLKITLSPAIDVLTIRLADDTELTDSVWQGCPIATDTQDAFDLIIRENKFPFSFVGLKTWTFHFNKWIEP